MSQLELRRLLGEREALIAAQREPRRPCADRAGS